MRHLTDFAKLGGVAEQDKRLQALHKAVDVELAVVDVLREAVGPLALCAKAVSDVPGAVAPRVEGLQDRIKSVLARKYATTSDNPILTSLAGKIEDWFHSNMPELDLGWEGLFRFRDMRSSNQDTFHVSDTNLGLRFERYEQGGKIKIRRDISESRTPVKYIKYGEGLGLLDEWFRFQQFYEVADAIDEFRAQYYELQAVQHYGLFTAQSSGINQAFATDDTTTLNNAAAAILRAARTKGYSAGQSVQFDIVCSTERLGRIQRMLAAQVGSLLVGFGQVSQPIAFNIRRIVATPHVAANDTGYYLVLPGRKIQRGVWQDLQVESTRDIYSQATDWVGTCMFNALLGDADQVRRVLYA